MTALMDDESVQKLGIIGIVYLYDAYNTKKGFDYEMCRRTLEVVSSIPIRVVSIYLVFGNAVWDPVVDLLLHMFSPVLRVRTRPVFGK